MRKSKLEKKNKKTGKDKLKIVLTMIVILNLSFYQIFMPIAVSKALAEEETVVSEESSDGETSDEEQTEEKVEDDSEESLESAEAEEEEKDISSGEEAVAEDTGITADDAMEEESVDDQAGQIEEETIIGNEENQAGEVGLPASEDGLVGVPEDVQTTLVAAPEGQNNQGVVNDDACIYGEKNEESENAEAMKSGEETISSEENDDCLKCDNSCGCPEKIIENENEAAVANETEAVSDTGSNVIGEEEISVEETIQPENGSEENIAAEDLVGVVLEEANENLETQSAQLAEALGADNDENAIETGDATAEINAYNDINTNIVSENGERVMYPIFENYTGDINLLEKFLEVLGNASPEAAENLGSLDITNQNYAEISNALNALANSGKNTINGDGEIETGSAVAVANAANYVNQNIVGENWIFSAITVFGEWIGDLIVPGEGLLEVPKVANLSQVQITNVNIAEVENEVLASADTGENEIIGTGEIETGDAASAAGAVNIINTNIVKNNWFVLMINNMGNWSGNVINWAGGGVLDVFSYDFSETGDGSDNSFFGLLKIFNQNTASVKNAVAAEASTGGNTITGDGEIATGDAAARANSVNFINSNFVGSNWFFGMVNIMGTWQGDVVFAYPDLAISITDNRDSAEEGDKLNYVVAYKNIGQADCGEVQLDFSLPDELDYDGGAGSGSLSLSGLKAGEAKSFTVTGKVKNDVAEEGIVLEARASVVTGTKEVEQDNNSATDTTDVAADYADYDDEGYDDGGYDDWDYADSDFDSDLNIRREQNYSGQARPGQQVKHSIFIKNDGDSTVYGVKVEDKMLDPTGQEVLTYIWEIGDMEEGDQLLVEYDLLVNNPGNFQAFTYEARATGYDSVEEKVKSGKAIAMLNILGYTALAAGEEDISATAEAAVVPREGTVLGEVADMIRFPLWVWILAASAYYLAINWSLFPKYKKAR